MKTIYAKMNNTVKLLQILIIVLMFVLTACTPDPTSQLVGEWRYSPHVGESAKSPDRILVFYRDGTAIFKNSGKEPLYAKFTVLDNKTLKIEARNISDPIIERFKIVSSEELILWENEGDLSILGNGYKRIH